MKSEPPESRLKRVDTIHKMVKNGTYRIPAEAVADAILRHHALAEAPASFGERMVAPESPESDYHD